MKARLCSTKFDGLILLAVRLERQAIYTRLQITKSRGYTDSNLPSVRDETKISEEHDLNKKLSSLVFLNIITEKSTDSKKDVRLYLK